MQQIRIPTPSTHCDMRTAIESQSHLEMFKPIVKGEYNTMKIWGGRTYVVGFVQLSMYDIVRTMLYKCVGIFKMK